MITNLKHEAFTTQYGFILACVGSAVSMGNIWLFPVRLSRFGGATFLIPYFICVVLVSLTGVIGEIAFGRLAKGGPIKAYTLAAQERQLNPDIAKLFGLLSNLISLFLAIGYFVVLGWILRYLYTTLDGSLFSNDSLDEFLNFFYEPSYFNKYICLFSGILMVMSIVILGVSKGIERVNKAVVPIYFIIFLFMAIYLARLPGAEKGYRFILTVQPEKLLDPMIWIYALGQSFFSLALTGSGLMVYGSYLKRSADIPKCALLIGLLDTAASLLAAFVVIPAIAITNGNLSNGGPGLLFIYLPYVFQAIPGGRLIMTLFFSATLLAGLTTLLNLVEVPITALQIHLKLPLEWAAWGTSVFLLIGSIIASFFIGAWVDICSIYLVPFSAGVTGVFFYWILKKRNCIDSINEGAHFKIGKFVYYISKYVYSLVDLSVLIFGAIFNGIG